MRAFCAKMFKNVRFLCKNVQKCVLFDPVFCTPLRKCARRRRVARDPCPVTPPLGVLWSDSWKKHKEIKN